MRFEFRFGAAQQQRDLFVSNINRAEEVNPIFCRFETKTKMSKIFELILCGCIVLIFGGSSIHLALADDTMVEDKSIELLQQHLCRDECYKKVGNLCPPKRPIKFRPHENTFDWFFTNIFASISFCPVDVLRVCGTQTYTYPHVRHSTRGEWKQNGIVLRCRLCK